MLPSFGKMSRKKCEINLKEIEDETRLVEVTKSGNYDEADRLMQNGVSPDTTEYNRQLFYQSENYMTPLHFATAKGFPRLLKLFIINGGLYYLLNYWIPVSIYDYCCTL